MIAPGCIGSSSNPRFLKVAVDHFSDTGEWAPVPLVQKALTQMEDLADARREAKRLPYGHGRCENDRVVLSVRGIYGAAPNHTLLVDFELALKHAIYLYKESERWVEATISYRTLIGRCSFREKQAKRAISLLEREGLVTDSSYGAEIKVILPRIRNFLRIRDIDGYVERKAELDRKRRVRRLLRKPLGLLRWLRSEDRTVWDKILVGVLVALLVAALSAALFVDRGPPSGGGSPPDHPRKSAAARSGG